MTPPVTPEPLEGRHYRTILGGVVIAFDLGFLGLRSWLDSDCCNAVTWIGIVNVWGMPALLLLVAWGLISGTALSDVIDRLPVVGKK